MMNVDQAKAIVKKLCSGDYVSSSDLSSWLLDSSTCLSKPKTKIAIGLRSILPSLPSSISVQQYVQETKGELEEYNDTIKNFCYAISYLYNADKRTAASVISKLMLLLTSVFTSMNYTTLCVKLNVLTLLSEI